MSETEILENKLSYHFLRILLYLILLTPLWVLSAFLFPFITSKILYFRILIELIIFLYVLLALRHPELRPRWDWLTKLVWIYVAVILITSIFGVDFGNSFWGTVERGEGIITLLHFAVYFTILPRVFRTKEDWQKYLTLIVLVTAFTALYGQAQLACHDQNPLDKTSICYLLLPTAGIRISATIGNAAFFAAFLLFGIFLSLYLSRQSTNKTWRTVFYAIFFFELYLLFQTQTRGALLASILAFGLYFLFGVFKSSRKTLKLGSAIFLILLIGASLLVYLNREADWVRKNQTLARLANISLQDVTTQSRLDTWRASWQGWKDRFLIGWGYENYNLAFNKYFPSRIFKEQGSQIWFDRAHNKILDVAVTSGLAGLIAYLGIFVTAGIILWRLLRSQALSWEVPVILGVFLLGYFFQNLFVFETQATYLAFFLFLAHLVFLKENWLPVKPAEPRGSVYETGVILPVIFLILILVSIYFINIQPAMANIYTTQGIKMSKLRVYREIRPKFEQALSYGTYMDEEIRQRLADLSLEIVNSRQLSPAEQEELYQYVIDELNKNIKHSPLDVKNYLYLMNILNRFPDPQVAQKVLILGEKALELSPTRPQIYFELGQAAFFLKDPEKGLEYFRKAIALNPEPKESHLNYLLAGAVAGREDIVAEQKRVIREDKKFTFTVQDYLSIARAYVQGGNKLKVIESYEEALRLSPQDPELHARLAAAYKEICDIPRATLHVNQTVELNESFALEARQFLRELEQDCKK